VLIGGCTLKQLRSDGGALGWCKHKHILWKRTDVYWIGM
jgi:hypothetical protein